MRSRIARAILAFALVLALLPSFALSAQAASDTKGADFWLAFTNNYASEPELTLFITGETSTAGAVAIPGLSFSQGFTVTPGTVTAVPIPHAAMLTAMDGVEERGIHVTADGEVTVYGLNRYSASTDAFLGLPTDVLGNDYLIMSYGNPNFGSATEFAVVGTQNGTTVTITPSVSVGTHNAGVPFTVALNQGQTYQLLKASGSFADDLTGSIISADKPIAVFSGHQCTRIPNGYAACDHIVEQMTPTSAWGRDFVTMPLATRHDGDTFRFLASIDNTEVRVNGTVVATLDRGEFHERIIDGPARITSSGPILVAQFSNGTTFDGVTSDPFMVLVPPYEQFLTGYTVTTPASGFSINFINVVAPNAAVGTITLDGTAIPAATFSAIPGTGFSGAQIPVALGSHNLAGTLPFGLTVYGFDTADSYGYPGGLSLAPVALVTNLTLSPESAARMIGGQHCATATVTDQHSAPLAGVRVDFTVTGANPTAGQADTDAAGQAQFCYTGALGGIDTLTAAIGHLSDTSTVTWGDLLALTVQIDGGGTVAVSPAPTGSSGTADNMTYTFAPGTVVTLTATPNSGQVFTHWMFDGAGDPPYGLGWASPLTITLDESHTARATFVARPSFVDVPSNHAAYEAATELAARDIARGYTPEGCAVAQPPVGALCYGPNDLTERAQVATFLNRLLGLEGEDHGTGSFNDLAGLPPEMQRAVGTLAHYGIMVGYGNGSFGPYNKITHTETALVFSRAMVFKGYWTRATQDDPAIYPNLQLGPQARLDLVTFVQNAGNLPGFANNTQRAPVDQPAPRSWTAQGLWLVLNSYFGADTPGKGGYIP